MGRSAHRKPRRGPARRQGTLQDNLVGLWHKLAAPKQPPAIDRFLARELGRLDGLPRRDRLWLGDLLTDALRFGALTVFCEQWRRDGWQSGISAADRLAARSAPHGPELWRHLARLPAPVVFFWTFMRKRLAGAQLPPIAPPGPDAAEVWRAVRTETGSSDRQELRALWAGLPSAVLPLLDRRAAESHWSSEQSLRFLDRHALRTPVWLRVLDAKNLPDVRRELAGAGFSTKSRDQSLQVRGERGIYELDSYRRGLCEIQDLASQAIGDAVGVAPGDLVWDCCAGAGGKTVQLGAALRGGGQVFATDVQGGKLKDLVKRTKRAGLSNVRSQSWDGLNTPDFGADVRAHGGFDRVLVDAPCSGCGTWRRNVDGRLRFEPARISDWTEVQRRLIAVAADAVRPGGSLVYATCSWLPAENEKVVAAFCRDHRQWRCVASDLSGNPAADSDTAYWARLRRR